MPDSDLIAEGRRLLAAATPGRWLVSAAFSDSSAQVATAEFGPVCVVGNRDAVGGGVPAAADAALIAYAHNTYGPLLDELEQARAAFERLQRDTQQDYAAIASKQERDAQTLYEARARIAELEADSRACKAGLVEHQDFVNGLIYERDVAVWRVAELEQRSPVGYLVAHRDALAQWWAQEHLWPKREAAEADLLEVANDYPGADWRVLTCLDESGEPYRAGRPEVNHA